MNADEIKLTQIFLELHGYIRSCALQTSPMPSLVDDIVQQVYLEFVSHVDRWDKSKEAKPLLAQITRNISQQHWRQYVRSLPQRVQLVAEHLQKLSEQEAPSDRYQDELDALKVCIEKLPEKGKQMVRQYYFDQMPTNVIAQNFEMKPATVNRTLSRLRESLGQCIETLLKKEGAL